MTPDSTSAGGARCAYCGTWLTGTEHHWCERMHQNWTPAWNQSMLTVQPTVTVEEKCSCGATLKVTWSVEDEASRGAEQVEAWRHRHRYCKLDAPVRSAR